MIRNRNRTLKKLCCWPTAAQFVRGGRKKNRVINRAMVKFMLCFSLQRRDFLSLNNFRFSLFVLYYCCAYETVSLSIRNHFNDIFNIVLRFALWILYFDAAVVVDKVFRLKSALMSRQDLQKIGNQTIQRR